MTSSLFWLLLIPAVLTFGLITWLTVRACDAVERVYRRWQVRRELARLKAEREKMPPKPFVQGMTLMPGESAYIEIPLHQPVNLSQRRAELDGLATAQDRYARRIR